MDTRQGNEEVEHPMLTKVGSAMQDLMEVHTKEALPQEVVEDIVDLLSSVVALLCGEEAQEEYDQEIDS